MENKEIVFGRNPVLEYIKYINSGTGIELHVSEKAHGKIIDLIIAMAKSKHIKIYYEEKSYFTSLGSSSTHQGIVLRIHRETKQFYENELLEKVSGKKGLLVLLDHLTDPHNVGSIIRTAEALGGDGLIMPKANSAGITSTVIKTSAGATAHLDILTVPNVSAFISKAKDKGFWIIGTAEDGTVELSKINEYKPAVIVIGNEGDGMKRLTKQNCDIIVNIPLKGNISSLNASVAAGIIIYEFLK